MSLNFYVLLFFFNKTFFFCHITAPTVHTDDKEFQRISTLFREKTSRGDEVQHITSSSLLQLGIALWLRSFRIFPYAQRDGTREVRQKWQYRGLFGRLFSAVSSSAIEVDRSHPVPRSSCSENSRVVKLFLKEDESVYLSQLRKTFSPSLLGSA